MSVDQQLELVDKVARLRDDDSGMKLVGKQGAPLLEGITMSTTPSYEDDKEHVFFQMLLTQLRSHEEMLQQIRTEQNSHHNETRNSIQTIVLTNQQSNSSMSERVGKMEEKLAQIEKSQDSRLSDNRWWLGVIIGLLALFKDYIFSHAH